MTRTTTNIDCEEFVHQPLTMHAHAAVIVVVVAIVLLSRTSEELVNSQFGPTNILSGYNMIYK